MSIREDLLKQYRAFREENKDTPNSKPNRIILNNEAYDDMLATSKMKDKPNPTMTYDDVVLVCDPNQKKAIIFEKRRFHN